MKRRKFLIALGVVPPLVLEACSDTTPKPKTPTIVTGKVIDENNMPVEGWEVMFYGLEKIGISGIDTFAEQKFTDSNGVFSFSVIVPSNTDSVDFGPLGFRSNDKLNRKNSDYLLFIEVAGKFELSIKDELPPTIGQTNTYNYQIKKK
ncbi:MAG: Ig-like domain-containing protein [Arcicella sp.]|nr:Ig-like domain-containing protein [Arcicella sp.]